MGMTTQDMPLIKEKYGWKVCLGLWSGTGQLAGKMREFHSNSLKLRPNQANSTTPVIFNNTNKITEYMK